MQSQLNVLVVDDEPSIILAVKDEMEFEGFQVDSASVVSGVAVPKSNTSDAGLGMESVRTTSGSPTKKRSPPSIAR